MTGQTEGVRPMAPVQGVQSPGAGRLARAVLPRRRGPGLPEAVARAHAGQRRPVLPGAGLHLLGPQLLPAEPFWRDPGAEPQGRLRRRAVGRGAHRDDAHPHVAAANGLKRSIVDCV